MDDSTRTRLNPNGPRPRFDARSGYSAWPEGTRLLDRYRVLSVLGRGAMGTVYRVRDEVADVDVALKAIPAELARDPKEMERVRENFRLVHDLHHPHIAGVNALELDRETGAYYLVMECVEGEDLRQVMRRRGGSQPLTFWLPILRQVADALDFAHAQGIVHRDVKPSNVFVDERGDAKLLDFGIASEARTTMHAGPEDDPSSISGTATYMAPEQWLGRPQGPATDQYALGATIHHLLAGRCPFENRHLGALRESVLHDAPKKPEDLDRQSWRSLRRALAKQPKDRFANCTAFVEALATTTPHRRARWLAAGLGVLAVAAIGALIAQTRIGDPSPSADAGPDGSPPVTNAVAAAATAPASAPESVPEPAPDPDPSPPPPDPAPALAARAAALQAQGTASDAGARSFALDVWLEADRRFAQGSEALTLKAYGRATTAFIAASEGFEAAAMAAAAEQQRLSKQAEARAVHDQEILAAASNRWREITRGIESLEPARRRFASNLVVSVERDLQSAEASLSSADAETANRDLARADNVLNLIRDLALAAPSPPPAAPVAPSPPALGTVRLLANPPADYAGGPLTFDLVRDTEPMGRITLPEDIHDLAPGPHLFELGGHPQLESIPLRTTIRAGAQTVTFDLSHRPAVVNLDIQPASATVTCEAPGEEPNVLKPGRNTLAPLVTHTIRASARGYRPTTLELRLKPGETRPKTLRLLAAPVFTRP